MIEIKGVQFPDDAGSLIATLKASGGRFLVEIGDGVGCTNCGGVKTVFLHTVKGGPYREPPGGPSVIAWGEGGWYIVGPAISFACPVCNGDKSALIAGLWSRSGLEPAEMEWRLDYVQGMKDKGNALDEARRILEGVPQPRGILFLYGPFGTGKSGIAKAMVAAAIRAGTAARFVSARAMLSELRSSFGDADPDAKRISEGALYRMYGNYPLLAIDEVTASGASTDFATAALMGFLDSRYNARLRAATILTANLSADEFPPDLAYLASRLRDARRAPVGGISLRGQTAEQLDKARRGE